jgi:signal peptidase I
MATEQQPITPKQESAKTPPENFVVETLKTVGLSVLLALGMRAFVAEARYIPSGSMEPTLQIDDRLIVDKVSYRVSNPQRGDIVVFDPTETLQKKYKATDAFIKRVIGLPGDTVEVRNDRVTINGKPLKENYPSTVHPDQMTELYAKLQQKNPNVGNWSPDAKGPDWKGKVPTGEYLVLGDHRSNSLDGRSWGFVPKNKIVGKAIFKFWPINRTGLIEPQPAYQK